MLLIHLWATAVVVKLWTQRYPVDLEPDDLQIKASVALCNTLTVGTA